MTKWIWPFDFFLLKSIRFWNFLFTLPFLKCSFFPYFSAVVHFSFYNRATPFKLMKALWFSLLFAQKFNRATTLHLRPNVIVLPREVLTKLLSAYFWMIWLSNDFLINNYSMINKLDHLTIKDTNTQQITKIKTLQIITKSTTALTKMM